MIIVWVAICNNAKSKRLEIKAMKKLKLRASSKGCRRAYIFPMVLLATLSVGLFIVTLTQLQSSTKTRFAHLNDYQRAFNIAYSALVEELGNIQVNQWSNRTFVAGPVAYTRDLFGGRYNLLIEDYDVDKNLFNTKIRVHYADRYFLFYWRLKYVPDLLDFSKFTIPVYYGEFPNITGTMSDFDGTDAQVDTDLARRAINREKAIETGEDMDAQPTLQDALGVVGINNPDVKNAGQSRPEAVVLELVLGDVPSDRVIRLLEAIEPTREFAIRPLRYDFDAVTVDDASRPLLEAFASYMLDNPDIKIRVRGHADGVGGTEYNLALSRSRAEEVVNYLVEQGVDPDRLSSIGYGHSRPLADPSTPEGRYKNRRVEFSIVN